MKYIIMGLFSLLAVTTQAQVRGIVKDNTGEPVPGANVFWVNTGQGVTTKEDGSFSISKPSKSHMLVISFTVFRMTRFMSARRIRNWTLPFGKV